MCSLTSNDGGTDVAGREVRSVAAGSAPDRWARPSAGTPLPGYTSPISAPPGTRPGRPSRPTPRSPRLGLPALRDAGQPRLAESAAPAEDRAVQDAPRVREGTAQRPRGRRRSSARRCRRCATAGRAARSSTDRAGAAAAVRRVRGPLPRGRRRAWPRGLPVSVFAGATVGAPVRDGFRVDEVVAWLAGVPLNTGLLGTTDLSTWQLLQPYVLETVCLWEQARVASTRTIGGDHARMICCLLKRGETRPRLGRPAPHDARAARRGGAALSAATPAAADVARPLPARGGRAGRGGRPASSSSC